MQNTPEVIATPELQREGGRQRPSLPQEVIATPEVADKVPEVIDKIVKKENFYGKTYDNPAKAVCTQ